MLVDEPDYGVRMAFQAFHRCRARNATYPDHRWAEGLCHWTAGRGCGEEASPSTVVYHAIWRRGVDKLRVRKCGMEVASVSSDCGKTKDKLLLRR